MRLAAEERRRGKTKQAMDVVISEVLGRGSAPHKRHLAMLAPAIVRVLWRCAGNNLVDAGGTPLLDRPAPTRSSPTPCGPWPRC